ncbi:efflux RND transporter periplasmic adaptor subunit [Microbaculum marinisediminis]|uniref:Efflux RND transporter periplasmic adaptor subunit n=1 Tax=Microbaculum marinisediminis TaxID=2931392 RepID=A0AAW5R563_9HYPH|nr:efflux RND transporter periplasmic adaptor subunit [Microbaculum sp. A6E488]MCT8974048.1 efflux RND transporter periplasmic adaptor subunit [Microbaculum sp. A6E488]
MTLGCKPITVSSFLLASALAGALAMPSSLLRAAESEYVVEPQTVEDFKAVFATVQSADVVPARARIGGTVTELTVGEGDAVTAGQKIATIVDDKLALRIQGLEASIRGLQAALSNAETELKRGTELKERGIVAQARLDQLQTAADVARNQLQTAQAEKLIAEQQIAEGAVEAPGAGRVLAVPVTIGTVVLPGEAIAEIASDRYILRLKVPERHARHIELGDEILIGKRGMGEAGGAVGKGKIVTVYPRLEAGSVVADAEVSGLGGYFVGERALVRIAAGERDTYVIPQSFVFKRYGLDYVRVSAPDGTPLDVVVQLGQTVADGEPMVEVLGGLKAGDRLVRP